MKIPAGGGEGYDYYYYYDALESAIVTVVSHPQRVPNSWRRDRIVTRQVEYFNLDAILSVGYRVNSRRGTQFRIWATGVLREHLIRGYSVNERRLRELRLSLGRMSTPAST